jgi:hypothetical protein
MRYMKEGHQSKVLRNAKWLIAVIIVLLLIGLTWVLISVRSQTVLTFSLVDIEGKPLQNAMVNYSIARFSPPASLRSLPLLSRLLKPSTKVIGQGDKGLGADPFSLKVPINANEMTSFYFSDLQHQSMIQFKFFNGNYLCPTGSAASWLPLGTNRAITIRFQ